jgi:hypothetical protein
MSKELLKIIEAKEEASCDTCENTAKLTATSYWDDGTTAWTSDYCLDCAHELGLIIFDVKYAGTGQHEATVLMPKAIKRTGRIKDLAGAEFGYLMALYPIGYDASRSVIWLCFCNCGCGGYAAIQSKKLQSGAALDCSYKTKARPRKPKAEMSDTHWFQVEEVSDEV